MTSTNPQASFDLEDPLSSSTSPSSLFSAEPHHAASLPYLLLNLPIRRAAASFLLQLSPSDPPLTYLAVNYLDRFLSTRHLPETSTTKHGWIAHLLAVACLSLASKMLTPANAIDPHAIGEGFFFDRRTIWRMEMAVLGALAWRMRSVTPFSFLSLFLGLFRPDDDPATLSALKSRASCILFASQIELRLVGYRPSVVAASALLTASHELFPLQSPAFRDGVYSCPYLRDDQERLRGCCKVLAELVEGEGEDGRRCCGCVDASSLSLASCDTPVTVLGYRHRHCPSSESEMTSQQHLSGGDHTHHASSD